MALVGFFQLDDKELDGMVLELDDMELERKELGDMVGQRPRHIRHRQALKQSSIP